MKRATVFFAVLTLVLAGVGFVSAGAEDAPREKARQADDDAGKRGDSVKAETREFLKKYQQDYARLDLEAQQAYWKAANSGKKEDFDAAAAATLAVRKFHSDPQAYAKVVELAGQADQLGRVEARAVQVAQRAFQENQLPPELLDKMVKLSSEIERTLSTFRAEIDGKSLTNNELLESLGEENDSPRRQAIWEALKQVGGAVGAKLIELARIRNEAAVRLGFKNFWDMRVRLQEHDPQRLLALFEELDQLTRDPFTQMKAKIDAELSARFGVPADKLMPWHYDNPFFQDAPPSDAVDLNEFFEKKSKEDIVEISRVFFADVGLPADDILHRSDLYEREGKDQHAFCININRGDDVRTLCNVKPTAEWMDTLLHELGHGVYDAAIDPRLPFNLREPSQAFTTEGVAMLFGALAKTPSWLVTYAAADQDRVAEVAQGILEQRRREQLIFARWTMVMLQFEKTLYEDPGQDLNALWWQLVARYQQLAPPPGRNAPDWAAKPHFTIAPVYYHNYMMGELFAAQLRHVMAELAGHQGPTSELSFAGRKDFGQLLNEKVFKPGNIMPWPRFVKRATGEELTAKYYAREVAAQ